ncbi:hypothetical protein BBJ28_00008477 [Nothophytophthora sp. Chile5]|nr:hypothetical protein BBJ28_00008477 [Nothophytophthora sp. Chile5]
MLGTPWELMEHNVQLVFLFTVLSGYVYVLTASTTPVGFVAGVQGLAQLLCALPAGCAADYKRRDRVLVVAGVVGLLASLLTALAFQLDEMILIYVAFGLWGAFTAFQGSAMEALFADSVPLGRRSAPFMLKHVMRNAALVLGPLTAILLLWKYGDTWTLATLRPVLLFGAFLAAVSMTILFQFNDDLAYENRQYVLAVERELSSIGRNFTAEYSDYSLPDGDSTSSDRSRGFSQQPMASISELSELLRSTRAPENSTYYFPASQNDSSGAVTADGEGDYRAPVRPASACCGVLDAAHAPSLLFASDFIVSNGTGLVATFFPLFFFKEFALSPIHVQTLFALQPLGVALLSFLTQVASRVTGRMPMIVITRALGAISLLLMAFSRNVDDQSVLFLAHGALMHCTEPLRRSLLMDFVPKSHRARWNSLEGLTAASWTGSAVLGGFIVEAHGYRVCFVVAVLVYACGLALEMALIPLTRHAVEALDSTKTRAESIQSAIVTTSPT